MKKTAAELRAELREAEQREAAYRIAQQKKTPIIRKFTISKIDNNKWRREIFDTSCLFYEIKAEVTNRDEAKAAGHPDHEFQCGGMVYVFNILSGRIVCDTGGGTIWISSGWCGEHYNSAHRAMVAISKFIVDHPDGGDITDIVQAHRENIRDKR